MTAKFSEMPHPIISAKEFLRRRRSTANWSRLFMGPIRLDDGTLLFTLKDAAEQILKSPAVPSSSVAAERIIDAALQNGDMSSARAAVRLALHRLPRSKASVACDEAARN